MQLVGSVELTCPARTADHRHVVRQRLPGRMGGEQREQDPDVGEPRDHLLHRHHGDVHAWQRRTEAPVALVRDEDERSGVGRREVHAGDPDVGAQELAA